MLKFKSYIIVTHIAGWLLFMAFPLFFMNDHGQNTNQFRLLASPYYWLFCATFIALFYINSNLLIPKLFLRKKYIDYTIAAIALLSGIYFLQPFDKLLRSSESRQASKAAAYTPQHGMPPGGFGPPPGQNGPPPRNGFMPPPPGLQQEPDNAPADGNCAFFKPPPRRRHIDSTSIFIFAMIMALSTATRTVQQWQLTEQRAAKAEAGKVSAELSFLKAQINPHFLFNTLNNIYTLAVTGSDYTADSIMKLSNIMRYVTDEATEDSVALQNEVDCISDYIELQKLRIGSDTQINFQVNGDTPGKKIAPLVLMTFVENVFKYGISKNISSAINIKIDVTYTHITFFCQNQIFNTRAGNQRTGIGIQNTKQRLQHLYGDKHLLEITEKDNLYTVNLTLPV